MVPIKPFYPDSSSDKFGCINVTCCDTLQANAPSTFIFKSNPTIPPNNHYHLISAGGCLLGMLSDTKGRRFAILVSLVGALVSSLLTVFAPIIEIYILGRFFDGLCFGGYSINSFIISIEYSRPGTFHLISQLLNAF